MRCQRGLGSAGRLVMLVPPRGGAYTAAPTTAPAPAPTASTPAPSTAPDAAPTGVAQIRASRTRPERLRLWRSGFPMRCEYRSRRGRTHENKAVAWLRRAADPYDPA